MNKDNKWFLDLIKPKSFNPSSFKDTKGRPILYWCLEKEDFPSMSDKEWEEFVDKSQYSFQIACREVGKDFLETFWEYGQPIPPPLKERNE